MDMLGMLLPTNMQAGMLLLLIWPPISILTCIMEAKMANSWTILGQRQQAAHIGPDLATRPFLQLGRVGSTRGLNKTAPKTLRPHPQTMSLQLVGLVPRLLGEGPPATIPKVTVQGPPVPHLPQLNLTTSQKCLTSSTPILGATPPWELGVGCRAIWTALRP